MLFFVWTRKHANYEYSGMPTFLSSGMICLAGPNLSGLFGRTSGTTAGYTYSKANKDKAVDWSEEHLYEYLLNPKKVKSQKFRLCCFVTCITV